jgi:hypothetical protein
LAGQRRANSIDFPQLKTINRQATSCNLLAARIVEITDALVTELMLGTTWKIQNSKNN